MTKKLTEKDKFEIAKSLKSGNCTERCLVKKFSTSKGAISRIKKNIDSYLNISDDKTYLESSKDKIYLENSFLKYKQLNLMVLETFNRLRNFSIPLNGTSIKNIARKIAKNLGMNQFKASNGWIENFKKRNKLEFKNICGESRSADTSNLDEFYTLIETKLKQYSKNDVWNCDETGLNFKNPPSKSFVSSDDDCRGIKTKKERISILFCCNMNGDKMEPLVIGKSKKPRCFNGFDPKNIKINYGSSFKSWMTSTIFGKWLIELNDRMQKENKKILLVMDNVASHRAISLPAIEILYLPKNTTSITQPLDMGIIKAFKDYYYNTLIDFIYEEAENLEFDPFKKIDIKNALIITSMAWDLISKETIVNCFEKAFLIKKEFSEDIINKLSEEEINTAINEVFEEILPDSEDTEIVEVENLNECTFDKIKKGFQKLQDLEKVIQFMSFEVQKCFYEFKITFNKFMKKEYKFGKKITDFINKI